MLEKGSGKSGMNEFSSVLDKNEHELEANLFLTTSRAPAC